MRKLPKRWTETRVEVELIDQLAKTHERNDQREVGWIEADSSRLVRPRY